MRALKIRGGLITWLIIFVIIGLSCTQREADEIRIGAVLPLTGGTAKYGESAKRGIDLAVKEVNQSGGIQGMPVRVIYEDSQSSPQHGVAAARKLISVNKVAAIIGEMASSVTLAIAPVCEESKVVLISPASSSPDITEAGDYIFRTCPSDLYEGAYIARLAKDDLGLQRAVILYVNNDYGMGLKNTFRSGFEDDSHEVVGTEQFEQDANDFRAQIVKIRAWDPQGLLLIGYKEMILILRQMTELGLKCRVVSSVMFDDPEILEKAGESAEGTVFTTWRLDLDRKEARDFLEAFESEYGVEPEIFAPEAYDALKILAAAVERGGYDSEGIKSALYSMKDFPGASGDTSFDENGDVIKPLVVMVAKDGAFERFEPELSGRNE